MNDSRNLIRFAVVGAVLGVIWYFLYYDVVVPDGRFDSVVGQVIAQISVGILNVMGFSARRPATTAYIILENHSLIKVGWQCNGMPLYALFGIFVIAYPGPWRAKAWFIPAGIVAIFLVNLIRVVGLSLNQQYSRATMQFNHHYTFLLLVYGFIFWLWTVWVRRYGTPLATGTDAATHPTDPSPADGR